jgi:putative cardiolipin synthase
MRRLFSVLRGLVVLALVGGLAIVAARLAFPLPSLVGRTVSHATPASMDTALGAALLPVATAHPGKTGVAELRRGTDAFAARIQLARVAQHSIDAQYYIWQKDRTGLLLLNELRSAARRGVRVRLLLDDNGSANIDAEIAVLDAMPNVEVRLFNPFTLRSPRGAAYLFDFVRLNRRMHNKSFTVDGIATILGGRNVGDIYFARGIDGHYADIDVLAAGRIVRDAARDFDAYWASGSAYPIGLFVSPRPDGLKKLESDVSGVMADPAAEPYLAAMSTPGLVASLLRDTSGLDWVTATLVSDDPAKGLGAARSDQLLVSELGAILGQPERSLDVISAYFVPARAGTAFLTRLARSGVRVRILTNSMEATDVLPVHAAYMKNRGALLDAGVELYELKSQIEPRETVDRVGILGSSSSSLHAKTFAIDDRRVFVGSFNFDPRSVFLNCEMGVLIDGSPIAAAIGKTFDDRVPLNAYRVMRGPGGTTEWVERGADGTETRHDVEPRTTLVRRLAATALGWFPIDWML